jgi:Raf kinase inhibitor-like YbhB/YbcL family protein
VVGTVTTAYSNTVDANKVISQNPAAGTKVNIGSAVNYVKSLGKPTVPNVVGMTDVNANTAITSIDNLKVGKVTTAYSNTVDANKVISQDPNAGTKVLIGSSVNYVKSLGKPVVPNVVGKTATDANTAIVNAHLVVGTVTTAYSNTVDAGKVISQNPAAGTKVNIGSPVNYVKSLGKPTVPNVVGMTDVNANTAITSVDNLVVGTVTTAYSNTVDANKVISQSPAAGTKVNIGSAVNYVKSLGKLTSSAFLNNGLIPAKYTCDGENISPPLQWNNVAADYRAKSIALICDDQDASGFAHWVIFNIPTDTNKLAEHVPTDGVLSNGARQGTNDFPGIGYGGPCPPSGTHRYYFKIYVLDIVLGLPAGTTTKSQLVAAMAGHIIAQGQLIGRYTAVP